MAFLKKVLNHKIFIHQLNKCNEMPDTLCCPGVKLFNTVTFVNSFVVFHGCSF